MRQLIFLSLIIPLFIFGVKFNAQAGTISPDLQLVLEGASPDQDIDVIIHLTEQVDTKALVDTKTLKDKSLLRSEIIKELKDKADKTQKELLKFLDDKKAKKSLSFWIFNGLAATVRADVISELAQRSEVAEVRLDLAIPLSEPTPATAATPEWNIDAIRTQELWDLGFSGQNIVVANMDTGVDVNHSDLSSRWRGGANSWYDPNGEHTTVPTDTHGHGTQTMGIMVGGDAGGTSIGVAPGAQWIAVKIFKDAFWPNPPVATFSAIHAGFEWLLDPDDDPLTDDAPDIVNNSWEMRDKVNQCDYEFQLDIQNLKAVGIAVVFAAGNSGPDYYTSVSPANYPESFAVGAVNQNLTIANFSSRGTSSCDHSIYPEVVAPGHENSTTFGIKTSDLTGGGAIPESYAYVAGTSFAAPHAAGAMALLLEAFPAAAVSELEAALINTALDLGYPGADNDYGHGLIDIVAAYRSMVPCTDDDGDGFYLETVCGTEQDCDDGDAAINPAAAESKHDGIDQDCNGYDLTIDIISAKYFPATSELDVIATSDLDDGADLQLDAYESMIWNTAQSRWEVTIGGVDDDPLEVTVSGIEGAEIAATRTCTDTDGDQYFVEAVCGGVPDCDDTDAAIYPGAFETKDDGIDQDCNGYDLTIIILSAVYNAATMEMEVLATSGQDDTADLQLVEFGPMSWNPGQLRWEIIVTDVLENPGSVTVSGVEGSETLPTAPCTDGDLDGYYPSAVCGIPLDCNDNDNTIHPGASETKDDGIDQDCNGYDLTIDIITAAYFEVEDRLCVAATSILEENADLVLVGSGPMTWSPERLKWETAAAGVGGDPGQVTLQGVEGLETAMTTVAVLCRGDLDTDGDVDMDDLGIFAAAFGATSGVQNYDPDADLNADGDVDAGDMVIFTSNLGSVDCPICP